MKKNFIKSLIVTLALALVIGAVLGVNALAAGEESEESLAIVSQNVSYEGQTHLYYAVHYENVEDPAAIKLIVSWVANDGSTKSVTVTENDQVTLKDKNNNSIVCRAFKTPGVDAKNFTTEFTVKAVSANGTESASKTYSVTEYCYEWLTYISALETPTDVQNRIKAACEATLVYGKTVQDLLEYRTDDNPTAYSYFRVTDGYVNDHFVMNGETVTLTFNGTAPANKAHGGWLLTYLDGTTKTLSANSFTADGSAVISPIFRDLYSEGFTPGMGTYYSDASQLGNRYDYENTFDSGLYGNNGGITSTIDNGTRVVTKTDVALEDMLTIPVGNTGLSGANVVIFETDIMFSGSWKQQSGSPKFRIRALGAEMYINCDAWLDHNVVVPAGGKTTLDLNKWYNLRFEIYKTSANNDFVVKIFVNGSYKATATPTNIKTNGNTHLLLTVPSQTIAGSEMRLDNVFFGYAVKDYVAE